MGEQVLVTGGAGYIGSHTCKALERQGYVPIALDNLVYGHRQAVKWGPFIEGDLADRTMLRKVFDQYEIKSVIHFAAYAYVGESMRDPGKYFRNNVINTLQLLEAMEEAAVKTIVFSSSCATYGFPEQIPITESEPQQPVNPYGESKLFVERALGWYASAHGFQYAALRYFNAAGADPDTEIGEDHDPETHLIPLVIQAALGRRDSIDIYGTDYPTNDGTAIRDYIHVTDLADAHVKALRFLEDNRASVALNLGTGKGCSVREMISAVERATGRCVPFMETSRRAGDPPVLVADASKAKATHGWEPRFSDLDTIVTTAWSWFDRPDNQMASTPAGEKTTP
jgi:UDP-glucose-4-epimerase GalE